MYKALKRLKFSKDDGTIYFREPGDEVPEAESWRNVRPWINRGYITMANGEIHPEAYRPKVKPMVPRDPRMPRVPRKERFRPTTKAAPKVSALEAESSPLNFEALMGMTKPELKDLGEHYGLKLYAMNKEEMVKKILEKA